MRPWHKTRSFLGPMLEPLYRAGIVHRNRRFDAGKGVQQMPVPVISIGNLSTGGTGKTPLVAWAVRALLAAGQKPAIAMRGYKRDAAGQSDEADEYARLLPGTPVIAQPDRTAGIRSLLASPAGAGVTCIVLDDGFQHRRVARDLDVVLIDATRDPMHDRLLPTGDLREPVESLRRAHAIVFTRADLVSPTDLAAMRARLQPLAAPGAVWATCRHQWTGLSGNPDRELSWLRGKAVIALSAIGNAAAFAAQLKRAVGEPALVREIELPDHDAYSPATLARIAALAGDADAIITTEKDWSKLSRRKEIKQWTVPILRPSLTIEFDFGGDQLRDLVLSRSRPRPT